MLVRCSDVSVSYRLPRQDAVKALDGVTCTLRRGEVVGVLGRSGSGKSTLGGLLAGVLPVSARMSSGEVEWAPEMAGGRAALVPQNPAAVLSPFLQCGEQVKDILLAHGNPVESAGEQVRALFLEAGLPEERRADLAWPHELSGGELQRVAVARALAMGPSLLVADEATSALDPIHAASLLRCMKRIRAESVLTILWITHDPSEMFHFADRVITMDRGRIVEEASEKEFAAGSIGPMTRVLVDSMFASRSGGVRPSI